MDSVQEIKEKLDIVDVVSAYVKLDKAGVNWRACCPFHKEKTPSFFVSRERQSWHCFGGCSEGGDMFKFIMKIENADFKESLKILAQKAGVELHYENPQVKSEKDRLYAICEAAAKFFEHELYKIGDKENSPLEYLLNRGLSAETIKEFRLGFAPFGWRNLSQFLKNKEFRNDEIIKSGLVIQKDGGDFYDRFRNRIMFPLFDSNSKVAGFTGRVFASPQIYSDKTPASAENEKLEEAKYVNTPETPIFYKGKMLYGFHKSKDFIRKENSVILVEGQMDFLMAYQDGAKNIAATSGTALTSINSEQTDHLKLISRYTKNLILGFDMDEAGQKAAERAIETAQARDFNIKILTLPEGKDAADFVKENPGRFRQIAEAAKPIMEYYFERAFKNIAANNIKNPEIIKSISNYLLPKIMRIYHPVERAHWISNLAEKLKIKENYLEEETKKLKTRIKPAAGKAPIADFINKNKTMSRKEILAERLIGLLCKKPEHYDIVGAHIDYLPERHKIIIGNANNNFLNAGDNYFNYLAMKVDYDISDQENFDFQAEIFNVLGSLKTETIKERLDIKSAAIKEAEKSGDILKLEQLAKEFQKLSKELN